MALRPNYQVFPINLAIDGQQDIAGTFNYLRMVDAVDVNGNQALGALVTVKLARASGDAIPMRLNGLVRGQTDFYRIIWAAQPGVTATFLVSEEDRGTGVEVEAPPTKQIIASGSGTSLTAARVNVTNVATVLDAGATTTQSRTVKNLDAAATLYIGGAGVTAAAGYPLLPGESLTVSGENAPLYAIAAAAGPFVAAVLVEQ